MYRIGNSNSADQDINVMLFVVDISYNYKTYSQQEWQHP